MTKRYAKTSTLVAIAISTLVLPTHAPIDRALASKSQEQATGNLDQWRRIDFHGAPLSARRSAQIKVAIQTRGPSMQGLIRVPGAPASNFDTGNGSTVVDLINVGNDSKGYADVVALEILLTRSMPGQFYEVFAVNDADRSN